MGDGGPGLALGPGLEPGFWSGIGLGAGFGLGPGFGLGLGLGITIRYNPAMPSTPWYRDGLSFSCTRCGDCCTGAPGHVWVTRAEIERLARHLGLGVSEFGQRYLRKVGRRYSLTERSGGDCVFYDKGCTVYPVRPTQCRTFPFWPENLRTRAAWEEVGDECPGVGKGRLQPLEEIRRIKSGDAKTGKGS